MDNQKQVLEIIKYKQRLSKIIGKEIPNNIAALIWIRKYAKIWRLQHPSIRQMCMQ